MRTKLIYSVLMFVLSFGFFSSSFSQNSPAELKKLSKGADVILTGKVLNQTSAWNENKTQILTSVVVQVDEYIKGSVNEKNVVVEYLGGEVGDVGELYSHMPTFKDNEEVLLFVNRDAKAKKYKVYQGEEGKLSLLTDKKTGEKMTYQNLKVNSLKKEIQNYLENKN